MVKYDWREGISPIADELIHQWKCFCELKLLDKCGSLSIRHDKGFVITGQDGHLSLVTECDVENSWFVCQGQVRAPNETIEHATIYQCDKNVGSVVHFHHDLLWRYSLNDTRTESFAGMQTPEMISEIRRLFSEGLSKYGIFVTAGHVGGIIIFGQRLDEVVKVFNNACVKKGIVNQGAK